jgi:hypothetical protein
VVEFENDLPCDRALIVSIIIASDHDPVLVARRVSKVFDNIISRVWTEVECIIPKPAGYGVGSSTGIYDVVSSVSIDSVIAAETLYNIIAAIALI